MGRVRAVFLNDSYQLKYTYEGEGELIYNGKTYTLAPNQGFVIDCRLRSEERRVGKECGS